MNEICVVRPNHLTEGEVRGEKKEQMFSKLKMKSVKCPKNVISSTFNFNSFYLLKYYITASICEVAPPLARGAHRHE